MKNWLKSSMDSNQVSNTIKGAVLAVSGTILFIAPLVGFPLTESEVVTFASQMGLAGGALWTLYGLTMKLVMYFGKNK